MSELILMVGAPGSGKSTFISKVLLRNENAICVSRDKIRFSMVAEDEEYFSKENEVFNEFCKQIQEGLNQGKTVYADATHLNEGSRRKILNKLNLSEVDIYVIFINATLNECLERNNLRKGTRGYVPEEVIRNMYFRTSKPQGNELKLYKKVIMYRG